MQTEKHRERLIELIKKSRREWLEKEYDHETEKSVDEYVADYLMSNNVVVLPCRVGDIVYEIERLDFESCKHSGENGDTCPYLYAEVGFGYECSKTRLGEKLLECSTIEAYDMRDLTDIFNRWNKFGNTVFLQKEKAEAKLKEMRDGT